MDREPWFAALRERRETAFPWDSEFDLLATFNSERARGIVHTSEWVARMTAAQNRFNAQQRVWAAENGYRIIGGTA